MTDCPISCIVLNVDVVLSGVERLDVGRADLLPGLSSGDGVSFESGMLLLWHVFDLLLGVVAEGGGGC